jgi:hypothetical protein
MTTIEILRPARRALLLATASLAFSATASAQDVPRILGSKAKEWRLSLPAAYQRELDRIAPRIAVFTDKRYGEYPPRVDSASAPSVMIRDLNGDHRPEVILSGFVGDSVVVIGLITSSRSVTGKVLTIRARREWEQDGVAQILTAQRERGLIWIRWQDQDCKLPGWEFRLSGQKTTTRKSKCYYGE